MMTFGLLRVEIIVTVARDTGQGTCRDWGLAIKWTDHSQSLFCVSGKSDWQAGSAIKRAEIKIGWFCHLLLWRLVRVSPFLDFDLELGRCRPGRRTSIAICETPVAADQ